MDHTSLLRIVSSISDDALLDAIRTMPASGLCHLPYESAESEWTDAEGKRWTLAAHCLPIGARAILWTSCDEAPDDDHIVIRCPVDAAQCAQEYADEIASGL